LIAPGDIQTRLEKALPGATVTVRDMTGTADHYEVTVVAEAFKGMSLIERHRMIYAPLQDVLGGALHALSLKTIAPGE